MWGWMHMARMVWDMLGGVRCGRIVRGASFVLATCRNKTGAFRKLAFNKKFAS